MILVFACDCCGVDGESDFGTTPAGWEVDADLALCPECKLPERTGDA